MHEHYGVIDSDNRFIGPVYINLEVAKESFRLRHPTIEFTLERKTIGLWSMHIPDMEEMTLKLLPIKVVTTPKTW